MNKEQFEIFIKIHDQILIEELNSINDESEITKDELKWLKDFFQNLDIFNDDIRNTCSKAVSALDNLLNENTFERGFYNYWYHLINPNVVEYIGEFIEKYEKIPEQKEEDRIIILAKLTRLKRIAYETAKFPISGVEFAKSIELILTEYHLTQEEFEDRWMKYLSKNWGMKVQYQNKPYLVAQVFNDVQMVVLEGFPRNDNMTQMVSAHIFDIELI